MRQVAGGRDSLAEAIDLARKGNRAEARTLLEQVCASNPNDAKAWLWRASLAVSVAEAIAYVHRVLALEPDNQTARAWSEKLRPLRVEVNTYHCFLCQNSSSTEFEQCPHCHAVLTLDMDATYNNEGVKERQMRQAIARIQANEEGADPFDVEYFLGVAYLNLHDSYHALRHFRRAENLDPRGAELRDTITALSRRPLIMAVDDCYTIQALIANTLERAGYRCLTVGSGVEALSLLEEEAPVFVLLDVSMPFMDGYALCKSIKGRAEMKGVTVVMLSARDAFFDKMRGRMAGAADYLTKPFESALLLRVIHKYVGSKE